MTNYDLTLDKEVVCEVVWGIMGTISRLENIKGESKILKLIEKKIGLELKKIPSMTDEEINILSIKCKFILSILSELEGE